MYLPVSLLSSIRVSVVYGDQSAVSVAIKDSRKPPGGAVKLEMKKDVEELTCCPSVITGSGTQVFMVLCMRHVFDGWRHRVVVVLFFEYDYVSLPPGT